MVDVHDSDTHVPVDHGRRHILRVQLFLPPGDGAVFYPQVLNALENVTPGVQPVPPDGADLDITGALRFWDQDAWGLGKLIQLRLAALFGLCDTTVGGGPTGCSRRWQPPPVRREASW